MKTKTYVVSRRQTGQWLLAGLFVLAYVMVYAWLLSLAIYYPQAGNIGLAVMAALGMLLAHYLFGLIDQDLDWKARMSTMMVFTYVMLVIFVPVHLFAAFGLHDAGGQIFVAYGPLGLLVVFAILLLLRWLMNTTKEFRKSQL